MTYIIALICVTGIALGQLLFKLSAVSLKKTGSIFSPQTLMLLVLALTLYGAMTIVWIWILQKVDLGRIYPLMALAFVIVPVGSHYVFGERFQTQYFLGVVLIMTGIVISLRSP